LEELKIKENKQITTPHPPNKRRGEEKGKKKKL